MQCLLTVILPLEDLSTRTLTNMSALTFKPIVGMGISLAIDDPEDHKDSYENIVKILAAIFL